MQSLLRYLPLFWFVVIADSTNFWLGGTGNWSNEALWSLNSIPNENTPVVVELKRTDVIFIDIDVVVLNLKYSGNGTLKFTNYTSLTVANSFHYEDGVIEGYFDTDSEGIITPNTNTSITAYDAKFINPSIKHIRFVTLTVDHLLEWYEGELVMCNSTVNIGNQGIFHIYGNYSSSLTVREDLSALYDENLEYVMNTEAYLDYILPVIDGVFDLVIENQVHPTTSSNDSIPTVLWPLRVKTTDNVGSYYAQIYNASSDIYLLVVTYASDVDDCALLCNSHDWCQSFDFYSLHETVYCMLSPYVAEDIGGLTGIHDTINSNGSSSYHGHFEKITDYQSASSYINVAGTMKVFGSGSSSIHIGIRSIISGTLEVEAESAVNILFSQQFLLTNTSTTFLGCGSISSSGDYSKMLLSMNAFIYASCSRSNSTALIFSGGQHTLEGSVESDIVSIDILNSSLVYISLPEVTFNVRNMTVSNESKLYLYSADNNHLNVTADFVRIENGSTLHVKSITLAASEVTIDTTSEITAKGQGFELGSGPGAGSMEGSISASGGSYGGIGGYGMNTSDFVDTSRSYGFATYPTQLGSGGGISGLSQLCSGGAGGGFIYIMSKHMIIDGGIDVSGSTATHGCGGGSGGSILLNATSIRGSGIISAKGGDGGYAGGDVIGGGGGGGRVALFCTNYYIEATLYLGGGYRIKGSKYQDIDRAGPGTLYILHSTNKQSVATSSQPIQLQYFFSDEYITSINDTVDTNALYATIMDERLHINNDLPLEVRIFGSSRLAFLYNVTSISRIIGSGKNSILHVPHGISMASFTGTLTISSIQLLLLSGSLVTSDVLYAQNNSLVIVYGNITIHSFITDDSTVTLQRDAVISGSFLRMDNMSTVLVASESVIIAYDNTYLADSYIYSKLSEVPTLTIMNPVYFYGNCTINGLNLITLNNVTLGQGSATSSTENTLWIAKSSTLILVETDTNYWLSVDLQCDDCLWHVQGIMHITDSYILMSENAIVSGNGEILIGRNGKLIPGKNISLPMVISDSGMLLLDSTSFSSQVVSTVHLYGAGEIVVNGTETRINSLIIYDQGTLYTEQASILTISSSLSLQSGSLSGRGELRIESNAVLNLIPIGSQDAYLDSVTIINDGTIHGYDASVTWHKGAKLINYGVITFHGNQTWSHGDPDMYFDKSLVKLYNVDIALLGSDVFADVSVTECAQYCLLNSFWTADVCDAFAYNKLHNHCLLVSNSQNISNGISSSGTDDYWDVYDKVTSDDEFVLNNIGYITTMESSNVTIELSTHNMGTIDVPSQSNALFTNANFKQSNGTSICNGVLEISSDYDDDTIIQKVVESNQLSGNFTGYGKLHISGAVGTSLSQILYSDITSSSLSVIVTGPLTVYASSTSLTLRSLQVSDDAMMNIEGSSYSIVADSIHILGGSTIQTNNNSRDQDIVLTSKSLNISSGASIILSIAKIHTEIISVDQGGKISCSARGFGFILNESYQYSGIYDIDGSTGASHGGIGGTGAGITSTKKNIYSIVREAATLTQYDYYWEYGKLGFPGGHYDYSLSAGGGSLQIVATTVSIDGIVSCDGMSPVDSFAGGGSGGSIYINASLLVGSGTISVNGGDAGAISGGGGGGRLIVTHDNPSNSLLLAAKGGNGYYTGSAGTIFELVNSNYKLTISNTDDDDDDDEALPSLSIINDYTVILIDESHNNLTSLVVEAHSKVIVIPITSMSDLVIDTLSGDTTGSLILSDIVLSDHNSDELILHNITVCVVDAVIAYENISIMANGNLLVTEFGSTNNSIESNTITGHYTLDYVNVSDGNLVFYYVNVTDAQSRSALTKIYCNNLNINQGGSVHSDYLGYSGLDAKINGSFSNSVAMINHGEGYGYYGSIGGNGGSYGGCGGYTPDNNTFCNIYGNITMPLDFGSGGGGAQLFSIGGTGGGIVYIDSYNINLHGKISSNGALGVSAGSGGGSGGSIYLKIGNVLTGSGTIAANGGDGVTSATNFGGGGSGGRIAVHCSACSIPAIYTSTSLSYFTHFSGTISAYGGRYVYDDSNHMDAHRHIMTDYGHTLYEWLEDRPTAIAAAGTIYLHSNESSRSSLLIDNSGLQSATITYEAANSSDSVAMQESFELLSVASIVDTSTLQVSNLLLINSKTVVTNTLLNASRLCLDSNSTLTISNTSTLLTSTELDITNGSIELYGNLVGAQLLNLNDTTTLTLYPSGKWVADYNSLSTVNVSIFNTTRLNINDYSGVIIAGGSTFTESRPMLLSDNIFVDNHAYISATGQGYSSPSPGYPMKSYGEVVVSGTASGNISYGDGGSHCGRGGGLYFSYAATGNAFKPVTWGYAGGSTFQTSGGAGGGAIRLIVSNNLMLLGKISADGKSCATGTSGGGAGGSVWVTVTNGNLDGTGNITANGGDGCINNGGGAGSGGRIAIYESNKAAYFNGYLQTYSGYQNDVIFSNMYSASGGTIFIASSQGTNGSLYVGNDGTGGSDIYVSGEPLDATINMESITIGDSNVVLSDSLHLNVTYLTSRFQVADSINMGYNGSIEVKDGARLMLNSDLNISTFDMKVAGNSAVVIAKTESKLFIHTGYRLMLDTKYSRVYGVESDTSMSNLSSIQISTLHIEAGGTLLFGTYTDNTLAGNEILFYNSSVIAADNIYVAAGGIIQASAVLENDCANSSSTRPSFFGGDSNGLHAGGGGGNSGLGVGGYGFYTSAAETNGGTAKASIIYPLGAGGPGGCGKDSTYGRGGGALRVIIGSKLELHGQITVSGESSIKGSGGGGGAGGSLIIHCNDSNSCTFSGTGELIASGGHGSISLGGSRSHGGSGSGGSVAVFACNDLFDGVINTRGGITLSSLYPWYDYGNALENVIISAGAAGTSVRRYNQSDIGSCIQSTNVTVTLYSWTLQEVENIYNNSTYIGDNYQLSPIDYKIVREIYSAINNSYLNPAVSLDTRVYTKDTKLDTTKEVINTRDELSISQLQLHSNGTSLVITNGTVAVRMSSISGDIGATLSIDDTAVIVLSENNLIIDSISLIVRGTIKNATGYIVRNSAVLQLESTCDVFSKNGNQNLYISNATVTLGDGKAFQVWDESVVNITVDQIVMNNGTIQGSFIQIYATSIVLEYGSMISADALGFAGGTEGLNSSTFQGYGPGGGAYGATCGSGGGHGGYGSPGINGYYYEKMEELTVSSLYKESVVFQPLTPHFTEGESSGLGGGSYGSILSPLTAGSGGGSTTNTRGGNGGGVIRINTENLLSMDSLSRVSSNGESRYDGGGAGAGGSINIHSTVTGYGTVEAN